MPSSAIAGLTNNDRVVEVAGAAAGVRENVIAGSPHELKRRMLLRVLCCPAQRVRINLANAVSDLSANDGYPAEPAMVAVTLKQCVFFGRRGHSLFCIARIHRVRRRVSDGANLYVRTLGAPKRLSVVATSPLPMRCAVTAASRKRAASAISRIGLRKYGRSTASDSITLTKTRSATPTGSERGSEVKGSSYHESGSYSG